MSTSVSPKLNNPKILPPYHVILHNSPDHTFHYVIRMLRVLFGHNEQDAGQMAEEVHKNNRAIVATTSKERAELKMEQIGSFGPDPNVLRCQGSMTATIEPAE